MSIHINAPDVYRTPSARIIKKVDVNAPDYDIFGWIDSESEDLTTSRDSCDSSSTNEFSFSSKNRE